LAVSINSLILHKPLPRMNRPWATSPVPIIAGAEVRGKKLFVSGQNFDRGSVILINGLEQKTSFNSGMKLVAKKAGKSISSGQKVVLQVRSSRNEVSEDFHYIHP